MSSMDRCPDLHADDLQDLLADLPWLHRLARRLVRDPDLAEEVVQDTCAAALARSGENVTHPRAWLAAVLLNCARLRGRSQRARAARERAAARPERVDEDAGALVQRAELHRRIVGAVLRLQPHYRDVVLMRYFDNMPPRKIARRKDLPVATVHSRLQRALALLRIELDAGPGGRAGWAAVALAWPAGAGALPLAGIVMQTKIKIAAAVCVAVGTLTFFWPDDAAGSEGAELPPAVERASRGGSGGSAGSRSGSGGSALRRKVALRPERPAGAEARRVSVRGRVCDSNGRPLPGVAIAAGGNAAIDQAVSDAAGAFELSLLPEPVSLRVADDRYVTVLGARWRPDATFEPVLVAAPAIQLAGLILDEAGGRIGGANVTLQLPDDFGSRLSAQLDRAERVRWSVTAEQDGSFRLGRVPQIDGATLFFGAEAFRPETVDQPIGGDENMQVVLRAFAYEQGQLEGIVVDPAGAPVPGARVAMGVTSVVTDRDGKFALLLRRAGWPTAITAAKAGYLPASLPVPHDGGDSPEDWPDRIVLQLGQPPLSIRGVVRDQEGVPVAGSLVWIADPTLLGIAGLLPLYTEYLIAGGQVPPRAMRMRVPFIDEPTRDDMFVDNTSNVRSPTASWYYVETDDRGAFELPGLLPRDYQVRAIDPQTGITADRSGVPAGTFVEVTIGREGIWPRVRGRVVSLRGTPLAGVKVAHIARLFTADERVPGGRFEGTAIRRVDEVRTDDNGVFELTDVGKERVTFSFVSDSILPRPLRVEEIRDPLDVVVQVEARCHVEVVLVDPSEADEVAAFAADGEQVDITLLRSGSHQALTELALHEGKSGVFVLGESATRLVLRRGGVAVREIALALRPGETLRVQ